MSITDISQMLTIHLDEGECYAAWVCVKDDVDTSSDNKINYGGLVIQALLQNWVCSETGESRVSFNTGS